MERESPKKFRFDVRREKQQVFKVNEKKHKIMKVDEVMLRIFLLNASTRDAFYDMLLTHFSLFLRRLWPILFHEAL